MNMSLDLALFPSTKASITTIQAAAAVHRKRPLLDVFKWNEWWWNPSLLVGCSRPRVRWRYCHQLFLRHDSTCRSTLPFISSSSEWERTPHMKERKYCLMLFITCSIWKICLKESNSITFDSAIAGRKHDDNKKQLRLSRQPRLIVANDRKQKHGTEVREEPKAYTNEEIHRPIKAGITSGVVVIGGALVLFFRSIIGKKQR